MHLSPQFDNVFQFLPNPSIILLPDAPKFTIVAANKAYLETTISFEKDLIGKGIFEAFPENPEDRLSSGVENLRNSLNLVIEQKELHKMPLQKYDIPIRGTSKFKVKYFKPQNIPVKDNKDNIIHILHSVEDITDKKNLEITFETERQRFNDLYLQSPSCMGILKGPNHVFEFANPPYFQLIGEKDIIGKSVREAFPEVEGQGIFEIFDTIYKTGESFSTKEMLIKFDNEAKGKIVEMYQEVIYQPHKDINGKVDGIFFFFIDVTEKVASRKKIEESEKKYRELIENLPVATYSCDADGYILVYNKAAAALWGREPETGKDKWCGSLKIYSENGDPLPVDLCPMAIALKDGRMITEQEIIIERPNGEKVNILLYPVPTVDSTGQITGSVNVLIDTTKRKKAEEKLKKQNYQLDFQNEEKENRAAELFIANQELAYQNGEKEKRADELILANLELEFQNREKENRATELFLANKELAYQNEEKEKRADELILANIELEFQNREKENRAAELHFSNKELVKTNIELDHFVYSVSHDLRSPLTSILGLLALIEEDSREPDTLEQVKMMRTSINRLDGFIKNILSYSQNNRTGLESQKIPIKKTINDIVNSVRNIKEAKGISFQIDIDEQKPFFSDWHRFNTVLENLVANAIKYHTKEVPGRYLKLAGAVDKEELKLSISDNGIGIDPEFHEKIFQMFYRLPGNTDGSGFGLYIVKETLEKMQGKIEIQSEKGVGTTFIITLKNLKE